MDKYDAERQGLLKLDYLGLSTMAMIAEALRQLDMSLEELYNIPLEDPDIMEGFKENDCTGIFQFDGRATRSINAAVVPERFAEICDIIALCRPGPLHSGAAGRYIDVKHGREEAERPHPALDAITESTHYQIVYQEQILRVVTLIGGFDWTHASDIRRIISKKEGSAKFNQSRRAFLQGALALHKRHDHFPSMSENVADGIWSFCITAGAYAFNAAHCVSYGMLGAWSMWLKRKYPEVFYAAALAKLPAGDKIPDQHTALKRDASEKGIRLLPPHPRRSQLSWRGYKGKRKIRAGFAQVPGIGEKTGTYMLNYREGGPQPDLGYSDPHSVRSWSDFSAVKGIGPKTIEKIEVLCASEDPFGVYALDRQLDAVRDQLEELGLPEPTHLGHEIPYDRSGDIEVTWLGIIVKRNLRDIFESHRSRTGEELSPGQVPGGRPELNELVVLWCYDGTEVVSVRIDRFKYPNFKRAIWGARVEKDIILVRGVKPSWRTAREIYANELWVIDPDA